MALVTRTLTNGSDPISAPDGNVVPAETPITFQLVDAAKRQPISLFDAEAGGGEYVVSTLITATTNEVGLFTVALWPNVRGEVDTLYKVALPGTTIKPFYIKVTEGEGDLTLVEAKSAQEAIQPRTLSLFDALLADIVELANTATSVVTSLANGLMSFADKVKLDLIYAVEKYPAITTALSTFGVSKITLNIYTDQTLSTDLAVPANIEIVPWNGALIQGAYSFAYNGSTARWPDVPIFSSEVAVSGLIYSKPVWFGADPTGVVDASGEVQAAIASVATLGGTVDGCGGTYLLNDAGTAVNQDNTFIRNATFNRTSSASGWMLWFASSNDTTGGGVIDVKFTQTPVGTNPTGGVAFGRNATSHHANKFIARNIITDGLSQYGVGIWNGSYWTAENIRVLDHGNTAGVVAVGIGFFVNPDEASTGGKVKNIYAEIATGSLITASAAVKLQTHQDFEASGITAIGGTELSMSVDSISGIVSNVYIVPKPGQSGLGVGNQSSAHSFSGQKFTIDGVHIEPAGAYDLTISGEDGEYKLTGCTLRNITGGQAAFLNYAAVKDCTFENWIFGDIRLSAADNSTTPNSLISTNNVYRNLVARGGSTLGRLLLETSYSQIQDCGTSNVNGDTVQYFTIRGSYNQVTHPYSYGSNTVTAIKVVGNFNRFWGVDIRNLSATLPPMIFDTGSNGNRVNSGSLWEGTGAVTDSGYDNYVNGLRRVFQVSAAPTTGVWLLNDRAVHIDGIVGEPVAWRVTVVGGAKSTTRADNTPYTVGAWAAWSTGTTVWECTQLLGLTDSSPPDITGKTVGQTVVDGAETWTLRSLVGYSTTRANSTNYTTGTLALWTTGTTVWECTTGGTTASSPPSITGKIVGDTVTDGAAVWTLRATSGGVAYTTTRANSTNYQLETFARWTTGNSCWELTTVTGTTTTGAPSVSGKVVGDTLVDGTVTWTKRSNTTAVFTSEGDL